MKYNVLGLMSGTSMDGLDVALCQFTKGGNKWNYSIIKAKTYDLVEEYVEIVRNIDNLSGLDLARLDYTFGKYCADCINDFKQYISEPIDAIASHGQTIFHQPESGFTTQIGSGAIIAAQTGIKTISDFRSIDVSLGGQGAPLVPIGDKLLFNEYDMCINIGGFANVSISEKSKRVAWDICPANTVLNRYAIQLGTPYDAEGKIAKSGKVDQSLFRAISEIKYFKLNKPKSLGFEWVNENLIPLFEKSQLAPKDILATYTQFIATQISSCISKNQTSSVLITGGGAFNKHLIELIKENTSAKITVPTSELIEYKEALIFAFLGCLRLRNEVNVLSSVTGASRDHSAGSIYLG